MNLSYFYNEQGDYTIANNDTPFAYVATEEDAKNLINTLKEQFSGAIYLIRNERERQIHEKGWTSEHDDKHINSELVQAAAAYALPESVVYDTSEWVTDRDELWPVEWDLKWWKPSPNDRIKELVKAGALIVAEIERLQRLNDNPTPDKNEKL